MVESRQQITRHQSNLGEWELATALPHPALRTIVHRYTGYIERETFFPSRLEVPSPQVVMIVNFGPAMNIVLPEKPESQIKLGSFVSGIYDRSVLVQSTAPMRCVQVDLTPIGARLLIGQPMQELTNQSIPLGDLLEDAVDSIEDHLDSVRTWTDRFAILDRLLIGRVKTARPVSPGISWGWYRLIQSGGTVKIGQIANEIGWSRKHLNEKFRDGIGLGPKQVARMIRFDRAVQLAQSPAVPDWLEIAHACGYSDQSHFNRDFRSFAGLTPVEFAVRRMGDGGLIGQ